MNNEIAVANDSGNTTVPAYVYILEDVKAGERAYFARWGLNVTIANLPDSLGGGTHLFTSVQITHQDVERSGDFSAKSMTVSITARNNTLQRYFLTASTVRFRMWIIRAITPKLLTSDVTTLDFEQDCMLIDNGVLGIIGMSGQTIECTVTPEPFIGIQKVPRVYFSRTCQRTFGGPGCGFDLEGAATTTTIAAADRVTRIVTLSIFQPSTDFWRYGNMVHVETGQRVFIEWVDDLGPSSHARIRLRTWSSDFVAGSSIKLYPGCALTIEACTDHGNIENFGGFSRVPTINPVAHGG